MANISDQDKERLNNSNPANQQVQLGDAVQALGDGTGFTLPTSDPSVAGALWSSTGTVTVSSG